jgi:deoxyribodipyrimidine photo-lyase
MAPKRKSAGGAAAARHIDAPGEKPNARSAEVASKKRKIKASSSDSNYFLPQKFYPPEMSNARCAAYNEGKVPRPIKVLEDKIKSTEKDRNCIKPGKAVLHWFKRDLRLEDNRGLSMAADLAKEANLPLLCLFVMSPEDYEAHLVSPARIDVDLRTLEILQKDLAALDIPLIIDTVPKRKDVSSHITSLCRTHGINHIFANIEYEVDELRREAALIESCLSKSIAFNPVHDDVVVIPGELSTGQGKQYAVYTPWLHAWVKHIHSNPSILEPSPKPGKNPSTTRKTFSGLFDAKIPSAP